MNIFSRSPILREKAQEWVDASHKNCCPEVQYRANLMFEKFVYPVIGNSRINKVQPKQVITCIKMQENHAPSLARLLLQRLTRFFCYSKAMGWCKYNPAEGLDVVLTPFKGSEFCYLSAKEMPDFLAAINTHADPNDQNTVAFWLVAYTAVRRGEALKAEISEFDFESQIWTIPAKRVKTRKPHIVPLSNQVIALLLKWIAWRKKQGVTNKRLFDNLNCLLPLVYKVGYKKRMSIHGWRKVFSTHAHESGLWSIDAIELQLSHTIQGVRGVYNKAMLLDERRRLLQWYADEIDKWQNIGKGK